MAKKKREYEPLRFTAICAVCKNRYEATYKPDWGCVCGESLTWNDHENLKSYRSTFDIILNR